MYVVVNFKTNCIILKKEDLLVDPDPGKYFFIAQGMLTIDNVDDAKEMEGCDEAFDTLNFKPVNLN